MEDKNFIIFMTVTVLLVMVWFTFLAPKPEPKPPADQTQAGATAQPAPMPAAGSTAAPPVTLEGDTPLTAPAALAPEQTVTVKTGVYEVEFTSRGAAPKHWRLLDYGAETCFPLALQVAWPPLQRNDCEKVKDVKVDLIDQSFASTGYPLTAQLDVDGAALAYHAPWAIETPDDVTLSDGRTTVDVAFKSNLGDGRAVTKTYRFGKDRYDVDLVFKIEGQAPKTARADLSLLYLFNPDTKSGVPRWNFNGPVARGIKKTEFIKPEDVVDDKTIEVKQAVWAGFTSDYFLTAVISENLNGFTYVIRHEAKEKEDKHAAKKMVGWARIPAAPKDLESGVVCRVKLFMGPKDRRILDEVGHDLPESIDYGYLGAGVKYLIVTLVAAAKILPGGNYGLSIVIVTIVLRLGLFPLTRKSQKSMKQMQKLQPEIAKIREAYPDDKMKQNEEMQALWKRHKINPAMGCLPVLLQIPIFFAFYKAILISIELRQEPFVLWITDLSARDPFYVWPVAMGVTQLITTKMTPTQMDPLQQKIFMIMPLVFTYLLRDFPSGLLIYWTVSNIVSIGLQVYINRQPD